MVLPHTLRTILRAMRNKNGKVHPDDLIKKWKVLKGDKVQIMDGKDKGKVGEVMRVLRKDNRVLVTGLNLVKKHIRSTEEQEGGIFLREAPIHVSKVSLLDPSDGKPAKVSFGYLQNSVDGKETKVRYSRRSGMIIERPASLLRPHGQGKKEGIKDTKPEHVFGNYVPTGNPFEYWQDMMRQYGKSEKLPKRSL